MHSVSDYGNLAPNNSINALIYHCLHHLRDDDQRRFAAKFREQLGDPDQAMHSFRELILGAYLCANGFASRHEWRVNTKTPDWSIVSEDLSVAGVVELASFHIDRETERDLDARESFATVVCYWRDANKDNTERLYWALREKTIRYKAQATDLRIPYVVGICPDFRAAMDYDDDLIPCLWGEPDGLFARYTHLSGVLWFEEHAGRYSFRYAANSSAAIPIDIPSRVWPLEVGRNNDSACASTS